MITQRTADGHWMHPPYGWSRPTVDQSQRQPQGAVQRQKVRIVAADDNVASLGTVSSCLERAGYQVSGATDGATAWQLVQRLRPQLAVLDVGMPDMEGTALCRRIREMGDTLVMLLSEKAEREDRLRGYLSGCDDYVAKPCDSEELLARVKALLRRLKDTSDPLVVLDGGRVHIQLDQQRVTVDGREVGLTATEFRMLRCLAHKQGGVADYQELLKAAWASDGDLPHDGDPAGRHEIKVYISYMRRKLGDDARTPRIIQTVRTTGYRLADGDGC